MRAHGATTARPGGRACDVDLGGRKMPDYCEVPALGMLQTPCTTTFLGVFGELDSDLNS